MEEKISQALTLIEEMLGRMRRPSIAFSGGKDSLVVSHLVHRVAPETEMHYGDDELLLPEHICYINRIKAERGDQLKILEGEGPHAGWFWPWSRGQRWREPHPDMIWRKGRSNADVLGYHGVFLGLRRDESARRRRILANAKSVAYIDRQWTVCPILDWSDDDVWDYIDTHDLPYCGVYDVLRSIRVKRPRWRVGPMPLAPRKQLEKGWTSIYIRAVATYGPRWKFQ